MLISELEVCVGCWAVPPLIACTTKRAFLMAKGTGEERGKGDPVEAAGAAKSRRVWSASLGAPEQPPR